MKNPHQRVPSGTFKGSPLAPLQRTLEGSTKNPQRRVLGRTLSKGFYLAPLGVPTDSTPKNP